MELFFLKYNFSEEMKVNIYSWQEILFGLENKIITAEKVKEYASYIINENMAGYDIILEIICQYDYEDIDLYLQKLISLEEKQNKADIQDKWLYLILKWLYKNRSNIENILEIVEEIYEQFDYPNSIAPFVRYMPSEEGDLGSPELNRERLFKNWDNYLKMFEEQHIQ